MARIDKQQAEAIADDAIEVLKKDPERFRALLKDASSLLEEAASVLRDAKHADVAEGIGAISTSLRRATLLPVPIAAALIKKALAGLIAR